MISQAVKSRSFFLVPLQRLASISLIPFLFSMDSIYFLIDKAKYRQLRAAHRASQLATVPPHVK
jgi:hypothetical protein